MSTTLIEPSLIFIDFDGVLHPVDVWHLTDQGPTLGTSTLGHRLFEHALLLATLLAPYPEVRLVLSTSWVRAYGLAAATAQLPESLRERVVGATFDPDRDGPGFASVGRGYQILQEVQRRRPRHWVALDDDGRDWPEECADQLILTDSMFGLGAESAQAALRNWLSSLAQR
jgi:hypothetical protein